MLPRPPGLQSRHATDADRGSHTVRRVARLVRRVVREQGRATAGALLNRLLDHARLRGLTAAGQHQHALRQHHPARGAAAVPRRPRDRAAHQEPHPLERHGHGGARQQALRAASAATSRPTPRCATLFEVGFNHFFRAPQRRRRRRPDLLPGPRLARHLRARLPRRAAVASSSCTNFRRELAPGGGLSSYPHPWLMPDFWEFPTVSMGLAPICVDLPGALQPLPARPRPRRHRRRPRLGLPRRRRDGRAGDARRDHARVARAARQPDLRRQLQPAAPRRPGARQRQDHPGARGRLPRRRLERHQGHLGRRLGSAAGARRRRPAGAAHGRGRRRRVSEVHRRVRAPTSASTSSARIRELLELVEDLTDDKLRKLRRGGHDPEKVYAAYKARGRARRRADRHPRQDHQGLRPGRGRRGPQRHAPAEEAEREGAARVPRPLRHPDRRRASSPRRPSTGRPTTARRSSTCCERRARARRLRAAARACAPQPLAPPPPSTVRASSSSGTGEREVATTHGVRAPAAPPDERPDDRHAHRADRPRRGAHLRHGRAVPQVRHLLARRASSTSRSTPTSSLYYREADDGQLLEEGITEAGAMASFTAAGTAYATHGVQHDPVLHLLLDVRLPAHRRPDLAARRRARPRLPGRRHRRPHHARRRGPAAPGRPQPRCSPAPCRPCAPTTRPSPTRSRSSSRTASAACTSSGEDVFYYLTVDNEIYPHAADAGGRRATASCAGCYKLAPAAEPPGWPRVHLFGSGAILREALRAQELLAERGVAADVWSVTSYNELRRDALAVRALEHAAPARAAARPYLADVLADEPWPIVAASDYMKIVADQIAPLRRRPGCYALGTDGFGRSDTRDGAAPLLRGRRRVDRRRRALRPGRTRRASTRKDVAEAISDLGIDPEKPDPASS